MLQGVLPVVSRTAPKTIPETDYLCKTAAMPGRKLNCKAPSCRRDNFSLQGRQIQACQVADDIGYRVARKRVMRCMVVSTKAAQRQGTAPA